MPRFDNSQGCQVFAETNVVFHIPFSKNASNFASFCVADGFKTNLGILLKSV